MRKTRALVLAVLAIFAAELSVRADDTHTVKLKDNVAGDVIAVEDSHTMILDLKLEDAAGKLLKASTDKTDLTFVYTETILTQEAGKPATQLSRQYDKAEIRRGGKTITLSLQGKTLLIDKKDGKYIFKSEGEELTGVDVSGLNKEFNQYPEEEREGVTRLTLPNKPVAANDIWMIDMAPVIGHLKKLAAFETDSDKAKGTGTLRKVYTKDNRLYGILHFDMELPAMSFGEGARKFVLDDGTKIMVAADVDACIDGSIQDEVLKIDMKIDGMASRPMPDGSKAKFTISIHAYGMTTRKEQSKK